MIHPIPSSTLASAPSHYVRYDERADIPLIPVSASNSSQSSKQMMFLLAPPPTIAPRGVYVGELQKKWTFRSDHLPIGMALDGLRIASWNVLNPLYMDWVIEKNSQGLSRSLIAEEHVPIPGKKITLREMRVIQDLSNMMASGQHLIALQECGMPFLDELERNLPPHFKLIREREGFSKDQNAVIYDARMVELAEQKSPAGIFSEDKRPFMDLLFKRTDGRDDLHLFNAHVPGDPMGAARYEFASYVKKETKPNVSTVALGDMNFNEIEMGDAFKGSSFEIYTPYCTNISPNAFISKAIDHFMTKAAGKISLQNPDDLYPGLQEIVDLLEPPFLDI